RFRFAPPAVTHGAGGNLALTINADHSVGAGHYATYNGAFIVYLTEIIPGHVRTVGFSLAYSMATAIFGGFTPAISTALIGVTGDKAIPGAWCAAAALISLLALLIGSRINRHVEGQA
ncbi:hypothetical protein ACQKOE_16435, partial [Novosphingobium sp. NPDC080210]